MCSLPLQEVDGFKAGALQQQQQLQLQRQALMERKEAVSMEMQVGGWERGGGQLTLSSLTHAGGQSGGPLLGQSECLPLADPLQGMPAWTPTACPWHCSAWPTSSAPLSNHAVDLDHWSVVCKRVWILDDALRRNGRRGCASVRSG